MGRALYRDRLFVQLDIFHRELLKENPRRFYADESWRRDAQLAELVTPLVVEADGTVVPLGYGFARPFALGSIVEARLKDLASRWIGPPYAAFRELCCRVLKQLAFVYVKPA